MEELSNGILGFAGVSLDPNALKSRINAPWVSGMLPIANAYLAALTKENVLQLNS